MVSPIIANRGNFMENKKMTVLVVEPEKKPYVKKIDNSLRSLQHEVDGNIQAVYPFEDAAGIICDEEGKLNGKTMNRALRDDTGEIYDIVSGTFLIVGLGEENFTSLSKKQMEHYAKVYETPELFMRLNGKIISTPILDEFVQDQTPYTKSASYALYAGELPLFHYSYEQNMKCSECISKAIRENFTATSLNGDVLSGAIRQFGKDRVEMILALTVLAHEQDERISPENKEWAKNLPIMQKLDSSYGLVKFESLNIHPGVLNLVTTDVCQSANKNMEKSNSVRKYKTFER